MHPLTTDPERLGTTQLDDGRNLAWAEWGPPSGEAVLVCPGAATSRWLGFGAEPAHDLGLRLISLDRPGLGASDPDPGRTLLTWADDIAQFTARRRLGEPTVVGYSQGAPFALACAAAGIVGRAAVVSGTDELAHPAFAGTLPSQIQRMVVGMATDPSGTEAFFAGIDSADVLWDMVMSMSSEPDRAVYAEPVFAAAYRRALREGFMGGSSGYARDTALAMSQWPFAAEAITVPVDLWYGALDASPVHSPDHGATLAQRLPNARHHLRADLGAALLWTSAREVLSALRT